MNKSASMKNVMIEMEVLLCLAALLLLLFKHNVDGSQAHPVAEQGEVMDLSDFLEAGEEPVTHPDLSTFMKEHSDHTDSITEAETEDAKTQNEESDQTDQRDNWRLILVNKQNPVPADYEVKLTDISGTMQVDERIATDLAAMLRAAKDDGVSLSIVSAYRDMDKQTKLFEAKIRRCMKNGTTYMDAYSKASESVTVPGSSEHQLGLALDIVGSGHQALDESFGDTEAGKWLARYCDEYGFILRYPKGKEYITGIIYEPWHFRYVGREAAREIMGNEITLEEYLWSMGDQ
ncbi:MAG: M15 family metallopeptidase [Lachnospiraceae bacterium]|nr:M15 family metallopeptidase [Lachnospiraceae bacterium]